MSLLRFEVRYPDGRKEVLSVDGERALIGHGAHCDVRLPIDQSAYEHVSIEVAGSIVRAEARAFEPPATLGGMPFNNSPISPETPLGFGAIRIFVAVADSSIVPGASVVSKKEQTSPLIKLLALVVFPFGAWFLLSDEEVTLEPAPTALPEIFAAPVTTCPQTAPDQALVVAADKLLLADSKRERHPFFPKDGIAAVGLYEGAAVCFKIGNNQPASSEAAQSGAILRAKIISDFRARRIRLEHSLKVEDLDLARSDVKILRALTEGTKGDYVTWLGTMQQRLKIRGGS